MWSASTVYMILFTLVTVAALSFIGWVVYTAIKGRKKTR